MPVIKPDAKLQHPPGSLQRFVEIFISMLAAAASGRVPQGAGFVPVSTHAPLAQTAPPAPGVLPLPAGKSDGLDRGREK